MKRLALTILVTVMLTACGTTNNYLATTTERVDGPMDTSALVHQAGSLDLEYARIGARARSFVGLYVDGDGVYRARIRDLNDTAAVRDAVESAVRRNTPGIDASLLPKIVIEQATSDYTWNELLAYKDTLRDVLALPDAAFLDVDEVCGCITIGITQESTRMAVIDFVTKLGVPPRSVRIVLAGKRVLQQALTDSFRPVIGGVQIKNDAGPFFATGVCTIAVVADRAGATGFLTASHCTRIVGGVEATNFYQNGRTLFWSDYVAHESADPGWVAMPGCPSSRVCRRSDAAFAVIDIGNQNAALATIARPATVCSGGTACPLAVASTPATISLTGTAGALIAGTPATKIGRTTGATTGVVTRTCVDENVSNLAAPGGPITVLCQTEVSGFSDFGDSGGPVIVLPAGTPPSPPSTTAVLAGILSGGVTGQFFFFSPIAAAQAEVGFSLFPPSGSTSGAGTAPSACVRVCSAGRDACMREVPQRGAPRPQECVADYRACILECR